MNCTKSEKKFCVLFGSVAGDLHISKGSPRGRPSQQRRTRRNPGRGGGHLERQTSGLKDSHDGRDQAQTHERSGQAKVVCSLPTARFARFLGFAPHDPAASKLIVTPRKLNPPGTMLGQAWCRRRRQVCLLPSSLNH